MSAKGWICRLVSKIDVISDQAVDYILMRNVLIVRSVFLWGFHDLFLFLSIGELEFQHCAQMGQGT